MSNKSAEREKRRAKALRENLKRRKSATRTGAGPARDVPAETGPTRLRLNKAQKPD
jgi:hypothetical protein